MAQQIDTIIVDLQVSNREAVAAIEQATERLAELKQEEVELNKEREKGLVTEESYIKQLTAIREETERAKDSRSQYTKALKENVKQEKIYADSLNGLRTQLKALLQEYDNMSKAERESAKGKELVAHIQQVTDELSKAEQETGRFQRNVGNYGSALNNLTGKLNEWAVELNNVQKNGGQMNMTFGLLKKNADTFGSTLKLLAKNPFFVILRVVIGLFTLLRTQVQKNDDAMTALQSATAALKPVMDALRTAMEGVVKVVTAVANGFTAAVGAIGRWLGISRESAQANQDLVKSMDALEEKERQYTVGSAKRNSEISELRAKASERDKYTTQERLGFIDDAMMLEKQDLEARRQIAREKLRLAQLEAKQQKDDSDETKNRLAELEASMYQAEQAYNDGMRTLQRQRQTFAREEAAAAQAERKERQQRAKEAAAARLELLKKEQEARRAVEDATVAMMQEGEEKEVAIKKLAYERQRDALQERLNTEKNMTAKTREALNQQLVLLQAQHELDITKIHTDAERKRAEIREQIAQKAFENEQRIEEIGLQAATQEMQNELTKRLRAVEGNALETARIVEQEAQREVAINKAKAVSIQASNYATTEEYRKALADAEAQLLESEQKAADAAANVAQAMADTKQATYDAVTGIADAFGNVAGNMQNLFETLAEEDSRYADYANAMAYLQILVSTAVSIANAIQGATAAAAATGVAAPFTLPAFIAEMVGIVTGAIAETSALIVKSKQKPKYADGGVVHGAGTGTSDSITARVSNGESILTAKATAMFYDQLSAMNVAGGGKPFDRRGGAAFARGGVVSTSTISGGRQMADMADALRAAVADMHPVVSVREITSLQNHVIVKENIAKQ